MARRLKPEWVIMVAIMWLGAMVGLTTPLGVLFVGLGALALFLEGMQEGHEQVLALCDRALNEEGQLALGELSGNERNFLAAKLAQDDLIWLALQERVLDRQLDELDDEIYGG